MESFPISEVETRFTELAERTQREHVDHMFTENGRPAVVMMSAARYESLLETLCLLTDRETCADLAESTGSQESTTQEQMAELMRHRLGRDHGAEDGTTGERTEI